MNNQNSNLSTTEQSSNQKQNSTLDDAQSLAMEFEEVLTKEHSLLQAASSEYLQELAIKKQHLLESLTALEPQILYQFKNNAESEKVREIKDTLGRCRAQNRDNRLLTQVVLKHTNNSLELLRSLQQMDDLSLYAASGKISIIREQRRLGSA